MTLKGGRIFYVDLDRGDNCIEQISGKLLDVETVVDTENSHISHLITLFPFESFIFLISF